MSTRLRFLLLFAAAAGLPAQGRSLALRKSPVNRNVAPQLIASDGSFDYCIKDPSNGSVLRFNSSTGSYVLCGTDGTFEQGRGLVAHEGTTIALINKFGGPGDDDIPTVSVTVDTSNRHGHVVVAGRKEGQGLYTLFTIDDPNVDDGDCSSCGPRSLVSEGIVNYFSNGTAAIGANPVATQFTVVQKFSLNPDFDGTLTRLTAGLSRNGAGDVSFQFVALSDDAGQPGESIYEGPVLHYSNFPALPDVGVVHQRLRLDAGPTFWIGIRWNPSTDPVYIPFDESSSSPKTDVDGCDGSGCKPLTAISAFQHLRNIFLSADYDHPALDESGGFLRFGRGEPIDIVSSGSYCSYTEASLSSTGLMLLEVLRPPGTYPYADYIDTDSFFRTTPIASSPGTGLDGIARTSYGSARIQGLAYIAGSLLVFCTRPEDGTEFVCHSVSGYLAGTCGYTRIVGVSSGFEISCANAPADRLDRWLLQYDGSAWSTQALNPVTASPSIGSPEFGFPWYQARATRLGIVYEYMTTAGAIQAKMLNGNTVVGTYAVDTDDPPAGFNPALATRMGGDCTRSGLCIFGRYDSRLAGNVADMLDFRESPPEIKSWVLGSSPQGFGFGRDVRIDGRDGTALYASYSKSPVSGQFRLRLDYLDLDAYKKYGIEADYAAGGTAFPLSLSRSDGEWNLAHANGFDRVFSLTANCDPPKIDGHDGNGSNKNPSSGPPCGNLVPIQSRF